MPDYIPPEMWPHNSLDLNPVDFGIWESLVQSVYDKNIKDMDSLKKALRKTWRDFPQEKIDKIIYQFRSRCYKVKGKHV